MQYDCLLRSHKSVDLLFASTFSWVGGRGKGGERANQYFLKKDKTIVNSTVQNLTKAQDFEI